MPRGKASRRKRNEINLPSSGESIEDEDLILEHEDAPKKLAISSKDIFETNKDQENETSSLVDESNIDPANEMNKMLQLLGNDMTKSVSAKRKKMEKFTDAAININVSKMSKVWNEQLARRTSLIEEFDRQIRDNVKRWEDDLIHQNEKCEKVNNILLQHMKVQQQIHTSSVRKLAAIRNAHETFSKNMKSLEEKFSRINDTVNQEMKTELLLLQKKILMETQQQDLLEVRKSVQTLLFS